jgi:hypothetical protein
MLKYEIEKKYSIKKKRKKPELTCLTRKTRDSSHDTVINLHKVNQNKL